MLVSSNSAENPKRKTLQLDSPSGKSMFYGACRRLSPPCLYCSPFRCLCPYCSCLWPYLSCPPFLSWPLRSYRPQLRCPSYLSFEWPVLLIFLAKRLRVRVAFSSRGQISKSYCFYTRSSNWQNWLAGISNFIPYLSTISFSILIPSKTSLSLAFPAWFVQAMQEMSPFWFVSMEVVSGSSPRASLRKQSIAFSAVFFLRMSSMNFLQTSSLLEGAQSLTLWTIALSLFFQKEMLWLSLISFMLMFAAFSIAIRSSMFPPSKNVMFVPAFPARPVLPERWIYCSGFSGGDSWIISSTSGMSIPRAAMSVAISIFFLPLRKRCMLDSRLLCGMSPWRITISLLSNSFMKSLASAFICVKMMVRLFGLYFSMRFWTVLWRSDRLTWRAKCSTVSEVRTASSLIMLMRFMFLSKYSRAICETQLGMVAENMMFCVLPAADRMNRQISSTSSLNPFSSIVSASSMHTTSSSFIFTACLPSRSINRPGVATTIATPLLISPICRSIDEPPYTATTLQAVLILLISFVTCKTSSRVGQRIRNFGFFTAARLYFALLNFSSTGSVYPSVFPDPVRSLARMSKPASMNLKLSYCTGNIFVMPFFCSFSRTARSVMKSEKSFASSLGRASEKEYLMVEVVQAQICLEVVHRREAEFHSRGVKEVLVVAQTRLMRRDGRIVDKYNKFNFNLGYQSNQQLYTNPSLFSLCNSPIAELESYIGSMMINLIIIIYNKMDRMQPFEFLLSSLSQRGSHSAVCFDRCIKKEQLEKELSRDQQRCLGSCWVKYQQAQKVVSQ